MTKRKGKTPCVQEMCNKNSNNRKKTAGKMMAENSPDFRKCFTFQIQEAQAYYGNEKNKRSRPENAMVMLLRGRVGWKSENKNFITLNKQLHK